METNTLERTIHTGCPIVARDNGYGRCATHHVRVYLDGHDWHVLRTYDLTSIEVLEEHTTFHTNRVTVTAPAKATDDDLAEAAGFNPRHHHGFSVTRYADGTASVSMWRD